MALLSTERSDLASFAAEYASVCLHALSGIPHGVVARGELLPAVAGLARRSSSHLRALFA
jgi:hypothetical protein